MDRRYSANSPYTTAPTERFDAATTRIADGGVGYAEPTSRVEDYPAYEDYPYGAGYDSLRDTGYDTDYRSADDSEDSGDSDEEFDDEPLLDPRWKFIAGVAGAVLLVAVICTVVILGGGDSGSVTATMVPPTQTSQPATTAAPPPAATSAPTSLPAETVTTVTPSPSATAAAPVPPPAAAAPPPPAPSPRTITYQVTGNRPLLDLVTVIYTDHQGALQSEVNVALPWTRTVVLDPGVELKSVTATSVTGQLNCAITDAAGATLASQAANTMIATCTQ
ncbi:hypothetical protein [Mycobacterium sp. NPDC050041]|uniref:hypothetical protein n=1 Tax=Mycobacterium sp. NPDC050041 TaxID=3364293 RepID=UPI003C300A8E